MGLPESFVGATAANTDEAKRRVVRVDVEIRCILGLSRDVYWRVWSIDVISVKVRFLAMGGGGEYLVFVGEPIDSRMAIGGISTLFCFFLFFCFFFFLFFSFLVLP